MVAPPNTTHAGAVVTDLLSLIAAEVASLGLTGVEVLDGDEPVDAVDDAIMLAPADPDNPGVLVTYGRAPSLGNAPIEQIEVAVVCRSYSGDGSMADRRARCAAMVNAVHAVIEANVVRAGSWDRLEMGPQAAWHPVYTTQGVNCYVGLSLVATALI